MLHRTKLVVVTVIVLVLCLAVVGPAFADNPHPPGGSGQPGQNCQALGSPTPGNSANAPGSPFNPNGVSGGVYNPGSQYDVACFQQSQHH